MDEFGNLDTADRPEFLANPAVNPMAEYLAKLWRKITPTQRTPGGLLAPVAPPSFGQIDDANVAMTAPTGALPPQPQPVPRRVLTPRTPGGALPAEAPQVVAPPGTGDFNAPDVARVEGGDLNSPPPRAAEAPQKGLREQYLERIAGMNAKAPSGMTDEQKGQALMEAGLAIMASASKPGSSALGAVGEGGLKGTAVAREMERINRAEADKRRAEDRANIGTEFQLAGMDEDRAIRKEDKAEDRTIRREDIAREAARDLATDTRENRRIDFLKQQIKSGETRVVNNDGTGTMILLNTITGEKKDTGIKFHKADGRPAAAQLIDYLIANPEKKAAYHEIFGEKGGISDKDIFNKAFDATTAQVKAGETTPIGALLQQNTDLATRAAGRSSTKGNVSKKSSVYRQYLKRPDIAGNVEKLDAALKANGYAITE